MLTYILLGFLSRAPLSGYDLEVLLRTSVMHFWSAKLSQIYRTLKSMEDRGLVTSEMQSESGRPDRRIYTITESGRQAYQAWIPDMILEVDDIRLPSMSHYFFYGELPKDQIITRLQMWREEYQQRLHRLEREWPTTAERFREMVPHSEHDRVIWKTSYNLALSYMRMFLDWIDNTLEEIDLHLPETLD